MPKAIAVASIYPYYDYFDKILTDLHARLTMPTSSLLEQYLFNIVF
jgi:hypothetical protein